jgi:hypothetical protein
VLWSGADAKIMLIKKTKQVCWYFGPFKMLVKVAKLPVKVGIVQHIKFPNPQKIVGRCSLNCQQKNSST